MNLRIASVALVAVVSLSGCTNISDSPATSPEPTSEADQKHYAGANTGKIDPETGRDMGVEPLMKKWVEDNITPIWGDDKILEEFGPTTGDDAENESGEIVAFNGTELYVGYATVTEDEFKKHMVDLIESVGYDVDRYECAGVTPGPDDDQIVRTCGVHFGEGELVDNDFFDVDIEWHAFKDTDVTHVAVTLGDNPVN